MDQDQNRRKDDARPAVALQWGDRPDRWTLLLTGHNHGLVGELGSTWPKETAEYERVNVRAEDAPMKLEDSEQYRCQMAGICTAALGYWKVDDTVHPDYDTPALRDVAKLYAKYEALYKSDELMAGIVERLGERLAMMSQYLTTETRAKFEEEWGEFIHRERAARVDQAQDEAAERAAVMEWANRTQQRGPGDADVFAIYQHGKEAGIQRDALYPGYVKRFQPEAAATMESPDCGACPGDGSICITECRHSGENPAVQNAMMTLDADRARRLQERGPDRRVNQVPVAVERRTGERRQGGKP